VAASFSKTWDAVIDAFADKTVSLRTIDRTSGLIAADPVAVPYTLEDLEFPNVLANCGKGNVTGLAPRFVPPTIASYNVRVRGDNVVSTILVTVRRTTNASRTFEAGTLCSSTGLWEGQFETIVKTKAEAHD